MGNDLSPADSAPTGADSVYTRTVLELDLAGYSDVAVMLEQNLDIHAVRAFEDQVQAFIDAGLAEVGLRRREVVLGTAGDNAILVFEQADQMFRFAEAVQRQVARHNTQRTVVSARRAFRIGAATGPVLFIESDRRVVGTTVTRAVRLEAAAAVGEILVDPPTYELLPEPVRRRFGTEELVEGTRSEPFPARRCALGVTSTGASLQELATRVTTGQPERRSPKHRVLPWAGVALAICVALGLLNYVVKLYWSQPDSIIRDGDDIYIISYPKQPESVSTEDLLTRR